jgi:nitrous oxide reductase accessory protein NosL
MTESSTTLRLSRRRLAATLCGALAAGLAGCTGGPGGDGGTETPSLAEPATVPEDANCAVCNMVPANFPEYNAQLSVEAGDRVFFCSSGCLAAFYVDPGHFDADHEAASFAGIWVHDHETKDLVDARTAWFVRETKADRVDDPMQRNPLAFAAEADALAYVEQYDDLSEADVLRLSDFDMDLATFYRGRFFE